MVGRKVWSMTAAIGIAAAGLVLAQDAPRKPLSPPGVAATMVGGTWSAPDKDGERDYTGGKWIEVIYARPMLRGRTDIFGKGANYGKAVTGDAPVWRVGANATTKLKTEIPLEIGGKKLPAGEYAVFVDLKEGAWTLILSTQPTMDKYDENEKAKIWGSYGYDSKYDVVRAPMKMVIPQATVDQFTIAFADMTDKTGKLAMVWDKTGAVVPFSF